MSARSGRPILGRPVIRWGLGDAAWVWGAGLLAATVLGSIVAAARGRATGAEADAVDVAVALVAQDGTIFAALVWVARFKGRGSLRQDLGLVVRARDWPWLAAGVLLQVVSLLLVRLVDLVGGGLSEQAAVRSLERASGPDVVLAALGVVLVAPLVEELLFRGLLLRALARRTTSVGAVAISAAVFAGVHLLDPSSAPVLVPLALVGVVSAIRAVRTGELSQSILLHAGFNLLSTAVLLGL